MKILTAEGMRQLDRTAIEQIGIPSLVLMENAALGVVDAIAQRYPGAESAAVFCGPGNNGGDGLAVARQLATRGYGVTVFLALAGAGDPAAAGHGGKPGAGDDPAAGHGGKPGAGDDPAAGQHGGKPGTGGGVAAASGAKSPAGAGLAAACGGKPPSGDAAVQLEICLRLGIAVEALAGDGAELDGWLAAARQHDLVIDALFGTGLGRPLAGLFARLVEALDELPLPRVAVDLPSGLSGSSATPLGPHLRADLTVTFAAPKVAHIFPPAAAAAGELVVADLGFPPQLVEQAPGDLHLLVGEELSGLLAPRESDGNKGTYGHLLVVAGSLGKGGAAVLATRAAVRAGAGLVTAAVPAPLVPILQQGSIESMAVGLPASASGALAGGAVAAVRELAAAPGRTAVALGPGLGQDEETQAAVRQIVLALPLPLVLDADGLNAFAGRAGELKGRQAPTILTPHPGELGRLLGATVAQVQADRPAAARRAAAATGAIVVLKGSLTLIAAPPGAQGEGGALFVNPTGNPGMATGGTGDVLTGIAGGLLAQRLDPLDAARLAVYLHGLAGDLVMARRQGSPSLAAADLIDALPAAFGALAATDAGTAGTAAGKP